MDGDSGYGNWPGLVCDRGVCSAYAHLLAAPGATSSPARGRRRPAMLVGLHVCVCPRSEVPHLLAPCLFVASWVPGLRLSADLNFRECCMFHLLVFCQLPDYLVSERQRETSDGQTDRPTEARQYRDRTRQDKKKQDKRR